ncbi:MAG: SPOR domain-containing protein [Lautropia sp.]
MARDNSRTQADAGLDPALAQKKRARHRLVGAVALCLLAALLIPLVLEAEPKQRVREVPIEIAARARPVVSSAGTMPGVHASGSIGPRAPAADSPAANASTPAASGSAPASAGAARSAVVEVDDTTRRASPAARAAEKAAQERAAREQQARAPSNAARPDAPRSDARHADKAAPAAPAAGSAAAQAAQAARDKSARERAAADKAAQERLSRERAAAREAATRSAAAASSEKATPAPRPTGDPLASLIDRSSALPQSAAARADAARQAKEHARRYLIQIGAYSNIEGARSVSNRVMAAGLRPYQETIRTDKGEVIRVRVGPFRDRASAEDAQKSLKAAGVAAAIVAL